MTIKRECKLVASDYLFLRDKLKDLHGDFVKLLSQELTISLKKQQIDALANSFMLTWLGPPTSEIIYPNIPKTTFQRVEQRIRDALEAPLDRIPLELDASIAELDDEMWQKVVECERPGGR